MGFRTVICRPGSPPRPHPNLGREPPSMSTTVTRRPSTAMAPLATYLRAIHETPLLSAEEEKTLARRIADGCAESRDHLVRANLRLVVNLARSETGKGVPLEDLIEEGNLGLLRAVESY